jgi:hypothetical protein
MAPYSKRSTPKDRDGAATAAATFGVSTELTATGAWQAVTLSTECKRVSINCDDGSDLYDHAANPTEFHFCFNSSGTGRRSTNSIDLSIDLSAGDTLGYVRATAGLVFSITTTS